MLISAYVSFLVTLLPLSLAQTPAAGAGSEPTAAPAPADIVANSNPAPTSLGDGLADPQIGAIVPTATGEIGVNPVDLPPASYAVPMTPFQLLVKSTAILV